MATQTNDAQVVVAFLKKNIFSRFGVPKALISDEGTHFLNRKMEALLKSTMCIIGLLHPTILRLVDK